MQSYNTGASDNKEEQTLIQASTQHFQPLFMRRSMKALVSPLDDLGDEREALGWQTTIIKDKISLLKTLRYSNVNYLTDVSTMMELLFEESLGLLDDFTQLQRDVLHAVLTEVCAYHEKLEKKSHLNLPIDVLSMIAERYGLAGYNPKTTQCTLDLLSDLYKKIKRSVVKLLKTVTAENRIKLSDKVMPILLAEVEDKISVLKQHPDRPIYKTIARHLHCIITVSDEYNLFLDVAVLKNRIEEKSLVVTNLLHNHPSWKSKSENLIQKLKQEVVRINARMAKLANIELCREVLAELSQPRVKSKDFMMCFAQKANEIPIGSENLEVYQLLRKKLYTVSLVREFDEIAKKHNLLPFFIPEYYHTLVGEITAIESQLRVSLSLLSPIATWGALDHKGFSAMLKHAFSQQLGITAIDLAMKLIQDNIESLESTNHEVESAELQKALISDSGIVVKMKKLSEQLENKVEQFYAFIRDDESLLKRIESFSQYGVVLVRPTSADAVGKHEQTPRRLGF